MGEARDRIMASDLKSLLATTGDGEVEEDDWEEDLKAPNQSFQMKALALIGLGTLGQAS